MKLSEKITQRASFMDGLFRIDVEDWASEADNLEAENAHLKEVNEALRGLCIHLRGLTDEQIDALLVDSQEAK